MAHPGDVNDPNRTFRDAYPRSSPRQARQSRNRWGRSRPCQESLPWPAQV